MTQAPDPGATWALRTTTDLDALNVHLPELETNGLTGITEEEGRATAWFPRRVDALSVEGVWERIPHADWHADWQARLEPIDVGPFRIAPPWKARPGDLIIEPAQAFGTGHHETTTGCLAALAAQDLDAATVLDVGTGTGVLAIAAARRGAAHVLAVDNDPLAVDAAADNARLNAVAITVEAGTADAIDDTFDVVVANIDTATLCAAAGALVARLAPGGTLIASGVSVDRAGEAAAAFRGAGLDVDVRTGREWAVLVGGTAADRMAGHA